MFISVQIHVKGLHNFTQNYEVRKKQKEKQKAVTGPFVAFHYPSEQRIMRKNSYNEEIVT